MIQETYQVAEIEISYKPKFKAQQRPQVSQSEQAYNIFIQQWDKGRLELLEEFKVLLLNTNHRVLGVAHLSKGGASSTVVDPKMIFSIALKANASAIIVAHNHPSGSLKPSCADINMTRKLKEGGKLLEIRVEDHLIITSDGYYSFADNGIS
ncbi:DNA repair protein [bacterium]|nr:MAG: DNA repair protein [bacterium]